MSVSLFRVFVPPFSLFWKYHFVGCQENKIAIGSVFSLLKLCTGLWPGQDNSLWSCWSAQAPVVIFSQRSTSISGPWPLNRVHKQRLISCGDLWFLFTFLRRISPPLSAIFFSLCLSFFSVFLVSLHCISLSILLPSPSLSPFFSLSTLHSPSLAAIQLSPSVSFLLSHFFSHDLSCFLVSPSLSEHVSSVSLPVWFPSSLVSLSVSLCLSLSPSLGMLRRIWGTHHIPKPPHWNIRKILPETVSKRRLLARIQWQILKQSKHPAVYSIPQKEGSKSSCAGLIPLKLSLTKLAPPIPGDIACASRNDLDRISKPLPFIELPTKDIPIWLEFGRLCSMEN